MKISIAIKRAVGTAWQAANDTSALPCLIAAVSGSYGLQTGNLAPGQLAALASAPVGWSSANNSLLAGAIGSFGIFKKSDGTRLPFRIVGSTIRVSAGYAPALNLLNAPASIGGQNWPFANLPSASIIAKINNSAVPSVSQEINGGGDPNINPLLVNGSTVPTLGGNGSLTVYSRPFLTSTEPFLAAEINVRAQMVANSAAIDAATQNGGLFGTARRASITWYMDLDVSYSPQTNGLPEDLYIVMPTQLEFTNNGKQTVLADWDPAAVQESFTADENNGSSAVLVNRYSTDSSELTSGGTSQFGTISSGARPQPPVNFSCFGSSAPYSFLPVD